MTMRFLAGFLAWPLCAKAMCACGYSIPQKDEAANSWVLTDMLESQFLQTPDLSQHPDWTVQQFNVSAQAGRGLYGKAFELGNVILSGTNRNDGQDLANESGQGSGLQLRVDSTLSHHSVVSAEIDTTRTDLAYGSFRAGMRLTDVRGTCAAFFWYHNDTQEIDMEFLSQQFDQAHGVYPVNLVIQSQASKAAGYDAQATGTFKQVNLTFDPTAGFHEYRFDYSPGRVMFYADSVLLAEMQGDAVPSSPGHLILQHWSNGNPLWSGGPPKRDAVLTVNYVKAYFNTTTDTKRSEARWSKRCNATPDDEDLCLVPDVTAANASDGGTFTDEDGSPDLPMQDSVACRYSYGNIFRLCFPLWMTMVVYVLQVV